VLWQVEQISAISAALEAARSGQPTLSVQGKPGTGTAQLPRETATLVSGFTTPERRT
jgi:hypothetical protein